MSPKHVIPFGRCLTAILWFSFAFIVLLFAGGVSTSHAQEGPAGSLPALTVQISSPQSSFSSQEDVVVHLAISNPTDAPIGILEWLTAAQGLQEPVFRVTRDGEPVAYIGRLYKRSLPTERDYVLLAPGSTLATDVVLSEFYDFSVSGQYVIAYNAYSPYLYSQVENPGGLVSNLLELSIGGRDPDLPVSISPLAVTGDNSFSACSSSQQSDIIQARTNAGVYAMDAASYLYSDRQGARYTIWFGTYDSGRYSTVDSHFESISSAINTASMSFDCSCTDDSYAWVYAWDHYNYHICNDFWSAPMTGTDSKAGTLVHETTHFWAVAGTDDDAYGQAAAKALALSDPQQAIGNADNHEYFAENHPPDEPPPANNDFEQAQSVGSLPYTSNLDTTNASTAPDDPALSCVTGQGHNNVWYRLTLTSPQRIEVNTFGSGYDTVLSIWTGTRGDLSSINCNDDTSGNQSQLTFAAAATTYYIQVAGYSPNATGSLQLHVNVANDDFANAEVIDSVPYSISQDATTASTAADDPVFQCGSRDKGSNSLWYSFTPDSDGTLTASTQNSGYDTILALWQGTRGNLTSVACNDDYNGTQSQISPAVESGVTYYLEVASYGASASAASKKAGPLGDHAPSSGVRTAAGLLNLTVDFTPNGSVCPGDPNGPLFTTKDNDDNAGSGLGDCDMETYIYNDSLLHPIEFNINVPNASSVSSAQLLLLNWDVDQVSGEVDEVYFNGHLAGTLTGANSEWSTTTLTLSPNWVVTGNNHVQINVDVTMAVWAVEIDWAQLVLNGQGGTAHVRSASVNQATYLPESTVHVIAEVDTNLSSQDVRTEINLRNPSGNILDGTSITHTVSSSANDPISADLHVPAGATPGTYSIQVLVYDSASNLFQHSRTVPLHVVNSVSFVSVPAQDGWIVESTETSNVGSKANPTDSTLRLGDTWLKQQTRSIVSFRTGAKLPDNAVITSISLKLKKESIKGGGNPIISFQGIMAEMIKGTFGLPALQPGDFQTTGAPNRFMGFGPFKPAVNASGWYIIRLPNSAGKYVNKTSMYDGLTQIRLRFKLDDNNNLLANYLSLFSGNATTGRPVLIIQYYVP